MSKESDQSILENSKFHVFILSKMTSFAIYIVYL